MNRTYIFLTFAVYGIGGTQIYVRNKLRFLKERGWDVRVITTEIKSGEPLVVQELAPYQKYIFPELLKNPNLFTKREREEILDRLCTAIGDVSKDSVIEPNFIQVTFWGELLAKRLSIRNFVFLIQEDYRIRIKSYLDFFKYKLERGELAVNTKYALRQLFDGYCVLPEGVDAYLQAACHNAVEDCESPLIDQIPNVDYVIGMIGRVNKPFVLPVITEIVDYASGHPDKSFLLLLLGGSPNKEDYEYIDRVVNSATNVQRLITGPIFPIPYQMIVKADVYVSSAGAVISSANCGMVTVAIEANDYQPIGIYGYTTREVIHRPPDAEMTPLKAILDQVLFEEKYKNKPVFASDWPEIEMIFDQHINFLTNTKKTLEYYDIRKVKPAIGLMVNEIKRRLGLKS